MNCFYLNPFYSVLTFLYFYTITNFYSHSHHYYGYSCYFFVIVIAIVISSFSILLTFIILVFTILFYHSLFKVGNKDIETVSVSLMGTLSPVFLTFSSDDLKRREIFVLLINYVCFLISIYLKSHI